MFREQGEAIESWVKRAVPAALVAARIEFREEILIDIVSTEEKDANQLRITGYWIENASDAQRGMFSGWIWTNRGSGAPDDCHFRIYTAA